MNEIAIRIACACMGLSAGLAVTAIIAQKLTTEYQKSLEELKKDVETVRLTQLRLKCKKK